MLGGAFWSEWREFEGGVDFGQKQPQVFVVGRSVCGGNGGDGWVLLEGGG